MSSKLNFSYELRLRHALNISGYLTSIIGTSKTGKTVLCEKVIGKENTASLIGNDFNHGKSMNLRKSQLQDLIS